MQIFIKQLEQFFAKEQILINEPMKNHTSFKIGGNASLIVLPYNIDEVKKIISLCKLNNICYYVMGNGTNLLVSDKGFNGVIIKLFNNFSWIKKIDECVIKASSGVLLSNVSNFAMKNCLTGLEFAFGIPGTLGGAICMNAGAYDGEMKQVVKTVTVLKDDEIVVLDNEMCNFEYRNSSILQQKMIVLEVEMLLKQGEQNKIKEKMDNLIKLRKQKQPLEYPSAGSVFKRPINNFAGKLIMDAGLKGKTIGGAAVSEKHCGFIINKNNATCMDVLSLIEFIVFEVENKFNIKLEKEVRIIGEF